MAQENTKDIDEKRCKGSEIFTFGIRKMNVGATMEIHNPAFKKCSDDYLTYDNQTG